MHVRVDTGLCIGTGNCVLASSAVFDQDEDDGTVVLLHECIGPEREREVRLAVERCPVQAIRLVD